MRLVVGASLVLAALAVATGTAAQEAEPLRLRWTAPAGCPSMEDVRAATLRSAAREERDARAKSAPLEADAQVEQRSGAWRVRLRTRRGGSTGEREIEASTCNGVAEATAVVLALALVPPGAGPPEETRDQPLVTVAMPASKKDVPAEASSDDKPRADQPRGVGRSGPHLLALGAGVSADASTLPKPTVGGALTVAVTPGSWRFEVDGRRWASQSASREPSGAGARFSMTSIGARGCWAVLRALEGALDAAPCLGGDAHFVSAPGYGADANYDATASWFTLDGGALVRLRLTSWLALRARVEAFVPLSRPTFVVEGEGDVHRPPTLGASASFGLEVNFL